jgi:DDE superfamily endonuclease
VGASERDEWLRAAWKAMIANKLDARRLVFVDEMGTNTSLAPIYAWAPKGQRAYSKVPRNRGPNTTLLASITTEGMGPCIAVVGSINSGSLRGVRRAVALGGSGASPGRGDGQPIGTQGEQGA